MFDLAPLDRLEEGLARLAPDVDEVAANRTFSAERRRATRRHRAVRGAVGAAAAALVVGLAGLTVGRSEPSTVTAGPSIDQERQVLNTFPLPAPGEASSVLLDDGMPVWVVNHGDGTASAVPALIAGAALPSALLADDRVFNQVLWDRDGAFDVFAASNVPGKALSWDAHGRAITADADLGGFRAVVEGETVRIERVATTDVSGRAKPAIRSEGGIEWPQLPAISSFRDLTPGWHQIEADIVLDSEGDATVCEPSDQTEPFGPGTSSTCPPDAPAVTPFSIRSSTPGTELVEARIHAPVVVHVNEQLVIDGVFPANGVSAIQR